MTFQDNAGVIVNPKGEMKGSAITGPVAKECVGHSDYDCELLPQPRCCRLTYGHVSQLTRALWFERFIHSIPSICFAICDVLMN